jgi:hypothetical protein
MALVLDRYARELVRVRRERTPHGALWLHAIRAPRSGWTAVVDWIDGERPTRCATLQQVDDVPVWVDERIVPYMHWKQVTLTAAKSGPFRRVLPADPILMFHLRDWEQSHPGLRCA